MAYEEEVTEEHYETFDGPYGTIEIIAVKRENSTALADLHRIIAEIMVKQARKKAKIEESHRHYDQ